MQQNRKNAKGDEFGACDIYNFFIDFCPNPKFAAGVLYYYG
jgi:hypothetical protein